MNFNFCRKSDWQFLTEYDYKVKISVNKAHYYLIIIFAGESKTKESAQCQKNFFLWPTKCATHHIWTNRKNYAQIE